MSNFDLKKYLVENKLTAGSSLNEWEGASFKRNASDEAFKNLTIALSKYKNVRAGTHYPVDDETYRQVEELIIQL